MQPIILADPPTYPSARDIYLPTITTDYINQVAAFYRLLTADQRQQRPTLGTSSALEQAAEERAYGLAHGDPWAHVDAAGVTPHEYARRAGCNLPASYALKGNSIESLVAGSASAANMFAALAEPASHRIHLFGLNEFFKRQTHMGIAVAEGGSYGWYWVVMIAICE